MFVLVGLCCVLPATASAQSGAFLEGLFRSIAEKQLEKQLSTSSGSRQSSPLIASPVRAPQALQPARPANREDRQRPARGDELRELQVELRQFQNEFAVLMRVVQNQARMSDDPATVYELRLILPQMYRIDAEIKTLVARSNIATSIEDLIDAYRRLDQRYNEVSFRLRSLPSRDANIRESVSVCDRRCRALSNTCSITPQFDRHGLHNQMIIAATYMQTLIDDLPTTRMPLEQSRDLVHQARLLRQAILEKANLAETVSYEDIVSDFTEFVERWQGFAETVALMRDPILDRRLARIAECADETYAILWMPPPPRRSPLGTVDGHWDRGTRPGQRPRRPGDVSPDDWRQGSLRQGSLILGSRQSRLREQWMSEAAALEVAAEYLDADLQRHARYLQPASYSKNLLSLSNQVLQLARTIHHQLDSAEPISRAQGTATELAKTWETLSSELRHLDHHGLTDRRAQAILRQTDQMLPAVASLIASLLPVN